MSSNRVCRIVFVIKLYSYIFINHFDDDDYLDYDDDFDV